MIQFVLNVKVFFQNCSLQDLPNCNWLEEKIKQSETQKWSDKRSRYTITTGDRNTKLNYVLGRPIHSSDTDSEEENLVVDDFLLVKDGNRSANVEDLSAVTERQAVGLSPYCD